MHLATQALLIGNVDADSLVGSDLLWTSETAPYLTVPLSKTMDVRSTKNRLLLMSHDGPALQVGCLIGI